MANLRKSVLLLCFTLLSHVSRVYGVDCAHIGLGWYQDSTGEWVKQLWPYTPNQGFDIIPAGDCYVRFQDPGPIPQQPQTPASRAAFWAKISSSRVTQETWTTTREEYIDTCNNFYNSGGTNAQLWLRGGSKAFLYAGILKGGYAMTAQPRLLSLNTVVTFLLPSGTSKVKTVQDYGNSNCQQMSNAGGIGITGTVDPQTDYAYTLAFPVAMGLAKRYPNERNQAEMVLPWEIKNYDGPFTVALRGDDECVVIDFSNMPSYLMTDNIHDSPVCNWDVMPPLQTQGDKQRVPLSSVAT